MGEGPRASRRRPHPPGSPHDGDAPVGPEPWPKRELRCERVGSGTGRIRTRASSDGGVPGHPLGVAYAEGFLLRFYAPIVDRLPDHLLEYLVAHELAHVLQSALGPERMFGCPADEVTEGMAEVEADEAVEMWGFAPSEDLDDWLVERGYIKRVEVATMADWFAWYEQSRYGSERLVHQTCVAPQRASGESYSPPDVLLSRLSVVDHGLSRDSWVSRLRPQRPNLRSAQKGRRHLCGSVRPPTVAYPTAVEVTNGTYI